MCFWIGKKTSLRHIVVPTREGCWVKSLHGWINNDELYVKRSVLIVACRAGSTFQIFFSSYKFSIVILAKKLRDIMQKVSHTVVRASTAISSPSECLSAHGFGFRTKNWTLRKFIFTKHYLFSKTWKTMVETSWWIPAANSTVASLRSCKNTKTRK